MFVLLRDFRMGANRNLGARSEPATVQAVVPVTFAGPGPAQWDIWLNP